jgi:hypothetical protein
MNMVPTPESLVKKWGDVLNVEGLPPIKDPYRRNITAIILENQEKALASEGGSRALYESAPTNRTGSEIDNYDPILISLVRRALPNLIAYDICGVQPMTGPTGLIFAMKSRYDSQTGTEALFNEADTVFGSSNKAGNTASVGTNVGTDPVSNTLNSAAYTTGNGMSTAQAEALGDSGANLWAEMAFSIDRVSVTAKSRKLRADYSMEMAQDLKAIHGLDAETELSNILSTEILAEINREVVRTIYRCAKVGAQYGVATAGTFNMDTDSNGRWMVERFKGLIFQIERECNALAKATRRGKGNILIVSADIASAMAMTGVLSYTPDLKANLTVDDTGNTYAGTLHGRIKVYVDPYFGGSVNGNELCTVGYKGSNAYDAGLFYCPYIPLQMVRAVVPDSFQPRIGFATRYGMVANPFATAAGDGVVGDRNTANQENIYYRIFRVTNLM